MIKIYLQTCWIGHNVNIGHYLHDILFPSIDYYLQNSNVKFILSEYLRDWEKEITLLFINHFNIVYSIEKFEHLQCLKKERNLLLSKNFYNFFSTLRDIIFKKYNITYNENFRVLYCRDDCKTRKLLNVNQSIYKHFDLIITDLSKLTFEEQVKMFMKTSHLVTLEGASLTNIIFMNKNAKVLDICNNNNSWQIMFGTSKLINTFDVFIDKNQNFNANILYSKTIENKILDFIINVPKDC